MSRLITFKKCFTCNKNKPLILYKPNKMKYLLPTDKGVLVNCRLCECKKIIKFNSNVVRYNFNIRKFEIVHIKPTLINLIKEYFI